MFQVSKVGLLPIKFSSLYSRTGAKTTKFHGQYFKSVKLVFYRQKNCYFYKQTRAKTAKLRGKCYKAVKFVFG